MSSWTGNCSTCGAPARGGTWNGRMLDHIEFYPPLTREDVANVRAAADYWQPSDGDAQEWDAFATNQKALRDLADRIETILPSEAP